METRQQSSSEMIIPVLELLTLHFGKGHVSDLNILNNITCILHPQPPSALETHQTKTSEVIIPVLEHGQLHVDRGRVSELNVMITIAISLRASLGPYNLVCFGNAP